MSSPSSPLDNALVLAIEAVERVLRAEAPDIRLVAAEVADASGPAHTFSVSGVGEGILCVGSTGSDALQQLLSASAFDIGVAIGSDWGAALDQQLTIETTGEDPREVPGLSSAVSAQLEGLGEPATLWIAVDQGLGTIIGDSVRDRLDDLEPAPPGAEQLNGGAAPAATPSHAGDPVEVLDAEFPQMGGAATAVAAHDLSLLSDVQLAITVELGRTSMRVRDLLELGAGSVVELDRSAGTPVDVLVNGTIVARGEVVVVDDELGVRVTEVIRGDNGAPS